MGIEFNWFKTYSIDRCDEPPYPIYCVTLHGGDSTSHSAGNVIEVQKLLRQYSNKEIPVVDTSWRDYEPMQIDLINPKEMASICQSVLDNGLGELGWMQDRIEWFKQLSDEGYYLAYDSA